MTYTAIRHSNSEVETISINKCRAIYDCWLVFGNASVCLYHHLVSDIPTEPNKLLYLAVMSVREGKWRQLQSPQTVFTYRHYTGTISSSVDLYGTINAESDSEAAVFLIGKERNLYRVKLLFLGTGGHRYTTVCGQHHKVIKVSATKHDVLVVCDNHVYWVSTGNWNPVLVTPQEFTGVTFTETSVNSYISGNSSISVGLIAVNSAGNFKYCFIGPPSQHPLNHCGMIPNVFLTYGILVTRSDISDTRFLALFNGSILAVINMSSNESYVTISTDFCYLLDDCYLLQTEDMVYAGNQWKTMVLYRETLSINATWNAGMFEVLPVIENALDRHAELPSSSPTSTNASATVMVNESSVVTQTNTTTSTAQKSITTSTIVTTATTGTISVIGTHVNTSTAAPKSVTTSIQFGTTTTSMISVHAPSTSMNIDVTTDTTTVTTGSVLSKTSAVESPSATDNAISTNIIDTAETNTKSELALIIIIIIILLLVIFILLLIMIAFLIARKARKYRSIKLKAFGTGHRERIERKHHDKEPSGMQSENDSGKPGGEVVMTSTDTGMYELSSTTTITTRTTVTQTTETTGTTNTNKKILFTSI